MIRTVIMLICAAALPVGAEPPAGGVPIEASGPKGPLAGTLLRTPGTQGPIALIIPGSGPTDRDGNSPFGIRAASYRLLAEGLFHQGVNTVRINKRGMFGHPKAMLVILHPQDYERWLTGDNAQDLAAPFPSQLMGVA